ncbi:riboflavin synthase domain-like protein [Linderina pennispora]|uniref:Methionine synthase reductase n=1 Tax=Linderina pennispora TaxID=61395 RepID=A0A1Y1WMD5_9FUNG|nr:riboflavin synthase domain-like protein [Linderina pennispora]ORX74264.1 riboflavin synthase domain-like protein [Linderina pennispora]
MTEQAAFVDSSLAILYASQTGNAESISYNIYEEAVKRGYAATWHVLDDHEKLGFNSLRTVVFVVSTTGDGDPPDNSTKFWRVLRKTTRSNKTAYTHLRYAILGLGDTNYSNFCNTAQRLDKQLQAAGAHAFYPKGLADDGTGLEETVEPWIDGLWAVLPAVVQRETEGVDEATEAIERMAIEPANDVSQQLVLDFTMLADLKAITGAPRAPAALCRIAHSEDLARGSLPPDLVCPPWLAAQTGEGAPFAARIASAQLITSPEALKRTWLMDLDLDGHAHGQWQAGDAFNVYAPNSAELVAALLARLGVSAEEAARLALVEPVDPKLALPAHLQRFTAEPVSICDLLTWAVDLSAAPRKQTLRALADCCAETADRDRLLFLSSRQGVQTFNELRRQAPTVLDILHAFASCSVTAGRLVEILPALQPRSYSICSAPKDERWRFAFNVVEYSLEVVDPFSTAEDSSTSLAPAKINRKGICTPWLEELAKKDKRILVALRPNINGFRLPEAETRPVIMVGPGTGVAPFIGFLQQREQEIQEGRLGEKPFAWLFFGCRHYAYDYLFQSELEDMHAKQVLTRLSTCFSRDAGARERFGVPRYLLVEKDAMVFVCGDAKGMGKDVNEALAEILVRYAEKHPEAVEKLVEAPAEEGGLSKVQALQVLMLWAKQKRYLRDLWA